MNKNFFKFLREEDFSDLRIAIKNLAMSSLRSVLFENAKEIEFLKDYTIESLVFKESLSIILTGKYSSPVFDMCIEIYNDYELYLGRHNFLVDLNMDFVDEFLVSYYGLLRQNFICFAKESDQQA